MEISLKRYITIFLMTLILFLASVATFNAVIDPYGMYRFYERKGVNANKPAIYNRVRLLKAYEVRRLKPQSIVLGTSRVHLGISPRHAGWAEKYDNRYNLAFDGATTKEMYAYLRHAYAAGRLEHVMLGLDTYHLSDAAGHSRSGFDPALLMTGQNGLNRLRMAAADFKLLTSVSTMKESIATLKAQAVPEPVWLSSDGQRLGDVFFRRPSENFVQCGPRCYFNEIDKLEVRWKLEWRIPQKDLKTYAPSGPQEKPDPVTSLGYVQKIIDFARDHNLELAIFLTPSHVHQLELDALTDNWWSIENGKRQIVSMLARDEEKRPDTNPIPLYDFSRYSLITTEPLPPEGSKREMAYYWDSSHFKENVGDMVLDCLFGSHAARPEAPYDFCLKLGPDNLEQVIASLKLGQTTYRLANSQDINRLQSWITDFKKEYGIVSR